MSTSDRAQPARDVLPRPRRAGHFQIAVELYDWEGLSTKELAEVLDVPEGTVRSRLARARDHLAEQLEALAASPELVQTTLDGFDRWAASLRALLG